MAEKLTAEDLREFAQMIVPNLAWDLTRSEVYRYQHSDTATATAVDVFTYELIQRVKAKIYNGDSFTVAIIPDKEHPIK